MAGKTLQTAIEISGVLSPSLQKAISSAIKKLDEMSTTTLADAGASEKLSAEIDTQEKVLKDLQKGYADYVISGQEGSEEAQRLADSIQQASAELDENRDALRAAETAAAQLADIQGEAASAMEDTDNAADDLGDSVERAGEKAEDSSEGYTILKNTIANLASDAIEKAVEAFKELATEGDTALGMLSARTGMTGEEMEGFEDVLNEVYGANYGESLTDVSEKLSTVIQMTDDLDNASLAKVTENAIALEDVLGYDVTESMRAVNSLMDQFGISSDEAFNLIVQGAQSGLDQNGDLLDTINEYSVQFKNAGYSAEDMLNMLQNGAETGTWSIDKLGDAVKEFGIRMSDGTSDDYLTQLGLDAETVTAQFAKGGEDAQAAISSVMEALENCEDASTQYTIGQGLFGTMWEDLGADTVSALMNTEGAIDSTTAAMEQMDSAAYDTLEGSISQLGRTLQTEILQPVVDKVTPAIKNAVGFVNSSVAPAINWLLGHLPQVGVALGTVTSIITAMKWSSILGKLGEVKGAVTGVISAIGAVGAPVLAVIAVIGVLTAAFTHLWETNEEFRDKVTGIWNGIKKKFDKFGDALTGKLNSLGFDFENISDVISSAWEGLCNFLGPVMEGAFETVSAVIGGALDGILTIVDIFSDIFNGDWAGAWETVKTTAKGVVESIPDALASGWEWLKTSITTVGEALGPLLDSGWDALKNAASTAISNAPEFLSGAWETFKGGITTVGETLGPLLDSGWDALKNAASTAISNAPEFLSGAWETFKGGITTVGETLGPLLDSGWTALTDAASTAAEGLKGAIETGFNAMHDFIESDIGQDLGGLLDTGWDLLTKAADTAAGTVKKAWEGVKDFFKGIWDSITGGGDEATVEAQVNTIGTVDTEASSLKLELDSSQIDAANEAIEKLNTNLENAQKTAETSAKAMSTAWTDMTTKAATAFTSLVSKTTSGFSTIQTSAASSMAAAAAAVQSAVSTMRSAFNFTWSLPNLKLPHITITGGFSIDPPTAPNFSVSWYKEGGILTEPTIFGLGAGEAGDEAVVPLSTLWDKLETLIRDTFNGVSSTGGYDTSLTSKAGQLLSLDDFSLGSLAAESSVVIYYDFSGFTWSPQIQTGSGSSDSEDEFMARLKTHEAEFFDWLEEFIQMREVAQYA